MAKTQAHVIVKPLLFVQLNDVYLHDAKADYAKPNGYLLPRVATAVKRLRAKFNKQLVKFVLPGDFMAPSCLGKMFQGRHMVNILDQMEVDYLSLGNHELEDTIGPKGLAAAIKNSKAVWLTSNFQPTNPVLKQLSCSRWKEWDCIPLRSDLHLLILGLLEPESYATFGVAKDPITVANQIMHKVERKLHQEKNPSELVTVALTHQRLQQDKALAKRAHRSLVLIMGGHDHDVALPHRDNGKKVLIAKALSNARTLRINCMVGIDANQVNDLKQLKLAGEKQITQVWDGVRSQILTAIFGTNTPTATYEAKLDTFRLFGSCYVGLFSLAIDTRNANFLRHVPEDKTVRKLIKSWNIKSKLQARTPSRQRTKLKIELIAEDKELRRRSTNLGNLIADGVRREAVQTAESEEPIVALVNSGAIRIDRVLNKGELVTARTLCDMLFYNNKLKLFRVRGRELRRILEKSASLVSRIAEEEGDGDFLQVAGLRSQRNRGKRLTITIGQRGNEHPLRDKNYYQVVCLDYISDKSRAYSQFFKGRKYELLGSDLKKVTNLSLSELNQRKFTSQAQIRRISERRWRL